MLVRLCVLSAAVAAIAFGSCRTVDVGSARTAPLHILSFEPSAAVDGEPEPIRIAFDRPVVPEEAVGVALAESPVVVSPHFEHSARWQDRQTLIVSPSETLAGATRYRVRLRPELERRVRGETEGSFVYRPLAVESVSGVDLRWAPPEPVIGLRFNHPVAARAVVERCTLRSGPGAAMALRTPAPDAVAAAVEVAPEGPLEQAATYALECDGLHADGGNEPLSDALLAELRVYPKPAVERLLPSGGEVTPDELRLELAFATPVPWEELRAHVRIEPAVDGFAQAFYQRAPGRYEAVINLEARRDYRVVVDGALRDRFGQTLGAPAYASFTTTDASPSMQLESGIYAIEASAAGYPVWTRNLDTIELDCAAVPRRAIPTVLSSGMNYDPWYDAGAATLDFQAMGLRKKSLRIATGSKRNKWSLRELDLPALCGGDGKRGLYLAELRSPAVEQARRARGYGRYPYRLLGNVTDLGVLLKLGPASGLVWVTHLSDASVVPGARVTLYSPEGKRIHRGKTDAQGILRVPGSAKLLGRERSELEEEAWYDYRPQRVIAVVEKDGDLAAVDGTWQNGLQIWNFGFPPDRSPAQTRVRAFIQSDRGIYRPGETVHFKGLLRELALGAAPRVPGKGKGKLGVEVTDARGERVLQKRLRLSAFGSFAFDLPLSEHAELGDYSVVARFGGQTFHERFVVEAFRPVSFEITQRGAPRHIAAGAPLAVDFTADYLFGAPVAGAELRWDVLSRPHVLRFPELPQHSFVDAAADEDFFYAYDAYDSGLDLVADGRGRTDARGGYRVDIARGGERIAQPRDYLVRVSVTDAAQQSVSKSVVVTAHPSELYLGLHSQEWVQAVGMPFAVNAVAVEPDGTRVAAQARLSLVRRVFRCEDAGEYRHYRRCERHDDEVWSRPVVIGTGGSDETITPEQPGEYAIRLATEDGSGNPVVASTPLWVIGKGEAFWSGDESARMSLVANKDAYEPGERALLVPRADTRGGRMLVTLERDGILDAFVVESDGSGTGVEVPLSEAHAPNVYASVALLRGRRGTGDRHRPEFKLGMIDLKVSAERQRLSVEVETERAEYEPGERVRGSVVVRAGGAPVRAELALSVADEGVLSLIGYKTPDPMQAFYASWGLGVDSSTNLNRIARLNDPSSAEEDEAGGDGGGEQGARVRSRFVSSALWIPALVTDAQGRATFSFDAPDNLTAFRLMAVAADTGARFGSADARIRVSKQLLAKPVLPRFAQSGDRVELGAVVHNQSDRAGTAEVTLEGKGLWTRERSRRVELAPGQSARVLFPVRIGKRARVEVALSVALGGHRDAFVQSFPVRRPYVEEAEVIAEGELAGELLRALDWPEGLAPGSRLEVSVDRTGLSRLAPALRYLVRYPYGCLEQTMSGLLPLLSVKELARSLSLAELRGDKLERFVRAGVDKVLRHQHQDGHFSLWPRAEPQPHLTAYAMFGLVQAQQAGVQVDRAAIEKGVEALRSFAHAGQRDLTAGGELGTMAMAAYVLAALDRSDPGLHARLLASRAALPLHGKAFLLRAMRLSSAAPQDLETVEGALLQELDGSLAASWPAEHRFRTMSSPVRDQAIALWGLLALDPEHPRSAELAAALEGARLGDGRWGNTQENVYALMALSERAKRAGQSPLEVDLRLGGAALARRTLQGAAVLRVERPLSKLAPGALSLSSSAPARYSVRRVLVREQAAPEPESRGFAVRREYLDAQTGQPVERARLGRLIRVRVTVDNPKLAHYVALDDPIPAGCEPVNARLATERGEARGAVSYAWNHHAMHDDRVRAFADLMPEGEHVFEYLLRPTLAGRFTAAPLLVEAMYEPTRMARSAARTFEVSR